MIRRFEDATLLMLTPSEMRRVAQREGYLCFRAYLEPDRVRAAADAALHCLGKLGYVAPERAADDGFAVVRQPEENAYGSGIDTDAYRGLQRLEDIHALARSPRLVELMRSLLGGEVLLHPNFIIRAIFPGGLATPPHQDEAHTRGSLNAWTCWIPLVPCPRPMGTLTILPRSHSALLPTMPPALGGLECLLPHDAAAEDWAEGDLELGDLLVFHGRTVHKALPNVSGDRLRVSIDCRYQPVGDVVREVTLQPHGKLQTWDEIYDGWRSNENQRFWEALDLNVIENGAPGPALARLRRSD